MLKAVKERNYLVLQVRGHYPHLHCFLVHELDTLAPSFQQQQLIYTTIIYKEINTVIVLY